ncbi:hypothetical protein FGO68_gene13458 [Halteria grandinella]|uniref:Uncharacterized protein n=1 Tax=Halteria grandinella TaxID=5974 RepID=A0A8J8T844_HALGN|nr:hypothetical protein FGO68_gene13458 [Halteria grandinella]
MVSAFKILQAQQRSSAEIAGSYQQQLEQISFTNLQLQATLEVNNIERQVLGGQVQGLHALIPIVENYKHLEDSRTFREEIMLNKLTECELDKSRLEGEIHNCLTDRNEIMSSFNVYKHQTTKQLEEKQLALNTFKQEMKGYIDEAQGKKTELEATLALLQKATAENQDLRAEMDKLRQRISMLRQNRNWNLSSKIKQKYCKNCKREYLEQENFNWSCRVHRSSWGGDIWWCCGKTTKGAPGKYKFSIKLCKQGASTKSISVRKMRRRQMS